MATAKASTGRVIWLERYRAIHTLEKMHSTVISSSASNNVLRIHLRLRKSSKYVTEPERMRMAGWLSPCGMGNAVTTILPEGVSERPSAYSRPTTLITGSLLLCEAVSRLSERGPLRAMALPCPPSSSQGIRLAGLDSCGG